MNTRTYNQGSAKGTPELIGGKGAATHEAAATRAILKAKPPVTAKAKAFSQAGRSGGGSSKGGY